MTLVDGITSRKFSPLKARKNDVLPDLVVVVIK